MRARPWTPLSTMPPPGGAWSIAMHKQSFTHYWFNTKKRKKQRGSWGARLWTALSTMPPPGETWSIGMHKQGFTHQRFTKKRKKATVVIRARPWTPLSTMPPPCEAWSIAMHKQSSTHQMVYPNVAKDVSGQSTAHKHPPCWAGVCVWQMRFRHKLLFLQKCNKVQPHPTTHHTPTQPHTIPHHTPS